MISFRYQATAVTAVALAVAAGLIVGDVVRHGSAADALPGSPAAAADSQNQQLQAEVDRLAQTAQAQDAAQQDLVDRLAPSVVGGRLTGVPVLVIATPAGLADVPAVTRMLDLAGATEVGRLRLTDAFTDPGHRDDLLDLATAALPPSVTTGLPVGSDGVATSSALLADVLLARTPPVTPDDRRSVLAAYSSQGYLVADQAVTGPATAVVLLTGPPPTGADAPDRGGALATLAQQLAAAGVLVVGSDGAAGTVAASVRAAHPAGAKVSTVDNAGSVTGPLVCVWALADGLSGTFGAYGTGPGTTRLPVLKTGTAPAPSPSPAASPTPTPTATPSPTPKPVG
jgi:hypothetical protein